MRKAPTLAALIACVSIAGCATGGNAPTVAAAPVPQLPSAIEPDAIRGPEDATALASGIAPLFSAKLPPGALGGSVGVRPASEADPIAVALAAALRNAGYNAEVGDRPGLSLTYRVGKLDSGVVARATVAGRVHAARAFQRAQDGSLRPVGAGSVMQIGGGR